MRKFIAVVSVVLGMGLIAVPAFAGGGQGPIQEGYYTFVWEMPHAATGIGENAPWPQELVDYAFTGDLNTKPDLNYLDGVIPECGFFQVDTYKIDSENDIERLTGIVAAGVLDWPQDSPIYHSSKQYEVDPSECETTTTTIPEKTTTTTEQETTTTTVSLETTSTSTPGTTSSSTPSSTLPTTSSSDPGQPVLPFTGSNTGGLVVAGLGLIGLGSVLLQKESSGIHG